MSSVLQPTTECPYTKKIPTDLGDFLKAKHSLFDDVIKSKTIDIIISELKRIPELTKYKTDLELVKLTANFIENSFDKTKTADQKKAVLIEIFVKLFGNLSDAEKLLITNAYDFLANNHKIKKIKTSKKWFKYVSSVVVSIFTTKKN
jgi:hypothetical protein